MAEIIHDCHVVGFFYAKRLQRTGCVADLLVELNKAEASCTRNQRPAVSPAPVSPA